MYDKFTVAKVRDVYEEIVYTIGAFMNLLSWGDSASSNHGKVALSSHPGSAALRHTLRAELLIAKAKLRTLRAASKYCIAPATVLYL